jgi:flagellar hook-length control protein FliK
MKTALDMLTRTAAPATPPAPSTSARTAAKAVADAKQNDAQAADFRRTLAKAKGDARRVERDDDRGARAEDVTPKKAERPRDDQKPTDAAEQSATEETDKANKPAKPQAKKKQADQDKTDDAAAAAGGTPAGQKPADASADAVDEEVAAGTKPVAVTLSSKPETEETGTEAASQGDLDLSALQDAAVDEQPDDALAAKIAELDKKPAAAKNAASPAASAQPEQVGPALGETTEKPDQQQGDQLTDSGQAQPQVLAVDDDAKAEKPAFAVKSPENADNSAADVSKLTPAPPQPSQQAQQAGPVLAKAEPPPPERVFAQDNLEKIVTGVRGELMPKGGTMQIRLDPPELGALAVSLTMKDGVVTATFQTDNADAARLLSHTLGQLKSSLEQGGMVVDKLQVRQASPASNDNNAQNDARGDGRNAQGDPQQQFARNEQQRRELLQQMWRRFSLGDDPLDLVA